jgi:hypothetical protein
VRRRWNTINRPALCALLAILGALVLAACGGERTDVNEPRASFTVDIPKQVFPSSQSLSEHTHLVLAVHNDSNRTIPDVAVTICNVTCKFPAPAGEGTSVSAFANALNEQSVANPSRQIWIIDKPPDPAACKGSGGYSCAGGSYGGATTADANTWALGPLKPGHTATFDWSVTATIPGHHVVAWEVSAGLSGKAKAVLSDGTAPRGTFPVTVSPTPGQSYVNQSGQIVSSPNGR